MKNFALWLGIPIFLAMLVPMITMLFHILEWVFLIGGTITAIVMTHKELGKKIEFGKTILPMLIVIAVVSGVGMILRTLFWGVYRIDWVIIDLLIGIAADLLISVSIVLAAGTWYMFKKASKPGWASIVPIYNFIVLLEIAKKPKWYIFMFFVPIANIVFMIYMCSGLSKNFGKDDGFTVGLVLLGQIFTAILGFGDDKYLGDSEKNQHASNSELLDESL
ncbi:MAG: DUF5684 domain-containing protein [Crocinitomicaceae bacterium]|nr:DUF5684 domain-containing protein [Crocinitomicaceae bacterium]